MVYLFEQVLTPTSLHKKEVSLLCCPLCLPVVWHPPRTAAHTAHHTPRCLVVCAQEMTRVRGLRIAEQKKLDDHSRAVEESRRARTDRPVSTVGSEGAVKSEETDGDWDWKAWLAEME